VAAEPRCAHFGPCGGCDLQDVTYSGQLKLKRERLVDALHGLVPAARIQPCLAADAPDAPWGLRRKVHFVLANAAGHLRLAHHGRQSRRTVTVDECPVHAPEGNRLPQELCRALDAAGARAFPDGPLRHIVVRHLRSGAPPIVTLVVDRDENNPRVRRAVGRFLDEQRGRVSMHVNVNDADTSYIFGRQTRHVAGPKRSVERVNGLAYGISATSFFQTNVEAAELLVRLVLEGAGEARRGERAVDLYAGVGLFALQLARAGFRVLAVEENPSAIADGMASARENTIAPRQCQFVHAPVRRLESWSRHLRDERVDVLVLDPPRAGVGAGLFRDILSRTQPRRVVYVSCDPGSLVRDLAAIGSGKGRASTYDVERVDPVDMFPQTTHVEAVVKIHAKREA